MIKFGVNIVYNIFMNITFHYNKNVANWILLLCFLILLMTMVGGITRLTNSGLSITEWKPIVGIIPPFNEAIWNVEFGKYKQTPEFKEISTFITMQEFKVIYLVEYFHRLFGRFIGIVFFIPLLYFYIKRNINFCQLYQLLLIFILGGIQGAIGWIMVQSGLNDSPHVDPIKLTMHLMLALLLLNLLYNRYLHYKYHDSVYIKNNLHFSEHTFFILLFIQIAIGGIVAGTKSGYTYNTFPLMDGQFIPDALNITDMDIMSIIYNPLIIQFIHRILGLLLLIFIFLIYFFISRRYRYVLSMILLQIALGILTLLSEINLLIAISHQLVAFLSTIFTAHIIFLRKNSL